MKAMLVFMQETCSRMIDAIDKCADNNETFELKSILGKYSMDTIASSAFGVDAQSFSNEKSKFVQYAANIFKSRLLDALKFLIVLLPLGTKLLNLFNISVFKKTEIEFFVQVIMASLHNRKETKTRRNDLIDLMLDAIKSEADQDLDVDQEQFDQDAKLNHVAKKGDFDEMTIVATAMVFLVAGYDTTGTTLSYACYQLAQNPDVQDRLRAEIEEVMGDSSRQVTYDDLSKMTYMDQVISETLRFHSPAGVLKRSATKEYHVPGTDVIIEEGMMVWVNVQALHKNPEHYSNPQVFDPEHFNKEAKAARNP